MLEGEATGAALAAARFAGVWRPPRRPPAHPQKLRLLAQAAPSCSWPSHSLWCAGTHSTARRAPSVCRSTLYRLPCALAAVRALQSGATMSRWWWSRCWWWWAGCVIAAINSAYTAFSMDGFQIVPRGWYIIAAIQLVSDSSPPSLPPFPPRSFNLARSQTPPFTYRGSVSRLRSRCCGDARYRPLPYTSPSMPTRCSLQRWCAAALHRPMEEGCARISVSLCDINGAQLAYLTWRGARG